jgi:transcriptional regulator with XRE-family HTH domain
MLEMAKLIRSRRLARKWSLRRLGDALEVTPAYVADLEAGRRQPSAELKERISSVLEISPDELAQADARLSTELKGWIEERPELTSMLRTLRDSPDSETLIKRLGRLVSRRARTEGPAGFLVTWESELKAIAAEASAWSIETGGDLFGRWHDVPTVLLATKAGPDAQRDHAHFRLDIDYLRHLSETMASEWVLRYFGDWHSHHRLGLSAPSGGDRRRIASIGTRNQFTSMAEIIVTLDGRPDDSIIRIHPWVYDLTAGEVAPSPLRVKVLPGLSPIRQALISRKALPEQELHAWEKASLQRIRIAAANAPPALEPAFDVDSMTRERVLAQLFDALAHESGAPIEHHATGFGSILVARLQEPHYLAFAVSSAWPMAVLEVNRMNRADGSTEPVNTPPGLTAPDIPRILEVFRTYKTQLDGARDVDA